MYNGFNQYGFKTKNIHIEDGIITLNDRREKPFLLDYDSFLDIIEDMGYYKLYDNKSDYYDENLEHHRTPPIAYVFYGYLWKYEKIPSFNELFDAYVKMYVDNWSFKQEYHNGYFEFTENALKGKIWRAYYSFIRELDLYLYLDKKVHAVYDFRTDYFEGTDIVADGVCVASLLSTQRSADYKVQKNTHRHNYGENTLEARLDMNNPYQAWSCNGVYLYTSEYMDEICERINKRR